MPVLSDPSEFNPDLVRFPTDEEKERELRLYFIFRKDALPSEADLVRLVGLSTFRALSQAMRQDPARFSAYWKQDAQAKIALKVKNAGQFLKTLEALNGFPFAVIDDGKGEPFMAAVGPACRAELGASLKKLQVLDDRVPEVFSPAPNLVEPRGDFPAFLTVVRGDAGMTYGKLAAQAGHAVMGALQRLPNSVWLEPHVMFGDAAHAWGEHRCPILIRKAADLPTFDAVSELAAKRGINKAYIIDNGRTVFNQPTATVLGIGPAPASVLHLLSEGLGKLT